MINANDVEQIIALTSEIKKLEEKKKTLTDSLKKEMISSGMDTIFSNSGGKISLTKSVRITVKKNMKDKLLLFLKQRNLLSCVNLEPEINKDTLETEINLGNISKAELEQYMNYTDVNTIRVIL